jgi:hypothetical protein
MTRQQLREFVDRRSRRRDSARVDLGGSSAALEEVAEAAATASKQARAGAWGLGQSECAAAALLTDLADRTEALRQEAAQLAAILARAEAEIERRPEPTRQMNGFRTKGTGTVETRAAQLVATQMRLRGAEREEIEDRLTRSLGIGDAAPIVAETLTSLGSTG